MVYSRPAYPRDDLPHRVPLFANVPSVLHRYPQLPQPVLLLLVDRRRARPVGLEDRLTTTQIPRRPTDDQGLRKSHLETLVAVPGPDCPDPDQSVPLYNRVPRTRDSADLGAFQLGPSGGALDHLAAGHVAVFYPPEDGGEPHL